VEGCCTPERLAWLNVLAYPTPGDARPSGEMLAHGRDEHLAPVLTELLRPAVVIARYTDAARAAAAIPGPWQPHGVLALPGRSVSPTAIAAARQALYRHGLCDHPTTGSSPSRPVASSTPSRAGGATAAGPQSGHAALRGGLLVALRKVSGFPPVERESYTGVGDRPVWAFVDRRASGLQVKFRVAAPYRVAEAICGRLAESGVDAEVKPVRSQPGSIRLWVRLDGPADLAALRRELPVLWRDYQQLR